MLYKGKNSVYIGGIKPKTVMISFDNTIEWQLVQHTLIWLVGLIWAKLHAGENREIGSLS